MPEIDKLEAEKHKAHMTDIVAVCTRCRKGLITDEEAMDAIIAIILTPTEIKDD